MNTTHLPFVDSLPIHRVDPLLAYLILSQLHTYGYCALQGNMWPRRYRGNVLQGQREREREMQTDGDIVSPTLPLSPLRHYVMSVRVTRQLVAKTLFLVGPYSVNDPILIHSARTQQQKR